MIFSHQRSTNSMIELRNRSESFVSIPLKKTCSNIETCLARVDSLEKIIPTSTQVVLEKIEDLFEIENHKPVFKLSNNFVKQENLKKIDSLLLARKRNELNHKWEVNAPPKIITSGHSGFSMIRSHSPASKPVKINESNLSLSYNSSNFSLNSSCQNSSTSIHSRKKITIDDIKFSINDDQLSDLRKIVIGLFEKVHFH